MQYTEFVKKYPSICNSIAYSEEKIKLIKQDITSVFGENPKNKFTVITTGSFGRKEASEESDLDLFIYCEDKSSKDIVSGKKKELSEIINAHIKKQTGSTGTFGSEVIDVFNNSLKNIGGTNDSNGTLTRRMLFLLEGHSLYGDSSFEEYRSTLINKYISSTTQGTNRIDKFLLNDIIRYYRTITTDFQYKVDDSAKSWGLRNIKLRFSRKLLYFAGILTIADVIKANSQKERSACISNHFNKPALERIFEISKKEKDNSIIELIREIFSHYEVFLSSIGDKRKRDELERIESRDDRVKNELYEELSRESNEFTIKLHKLLISLYDEKHPIHGALIF